MNLPQQGAVSAKESDLLNREGRFPEQGVESVVRGLALEYLRQSGRDRGVKVLIAERLSLVGANGEFE